MDDITGPALNIRRCEIRSYITEISTGSFNHLRILFWCVINTKRHNHFERVRTQLRRRWNFHKLASRIIHPTHRVCGAGLRHIVIVTHIEVVVDNDTRAIWNIKCESTRKGCRIIPLSTKGGKIEIIGVIDIKVSIPQTPRGLSFQNIPGFNKTRDWTLWASYTSWTRRSCRSCRSCRSSWTINTIQVDIIYDFSICFIISTLDVLCLI